MLDFERSHWVHHLEKLSRPLLEAFGAGKLKESFSPDNLDQENGEVQDGAAYLEAVGRLLNGISPWLELDGLEGKEADLQAEFRELAVRGIKYGTDPNHPDWFSFDTQQQTLVDSAFLAEAFSRAPNRLWKAQSLSSQKQCQEAFSMLKNRCPGFNNWLLFGAMPEAFLLSIGDAGDPMRIDYALRQLEQWYVGDGFYRDGVQFHNDYYNSIVILPMMRDILHCLKISDDLEKKGESKITQNRGNRRFYPKLLASLVERQKRMASHLERMISSDGSWPVIGRSITYRCGVFQSLAQSALLEELPDGMDPASVRGALGAAINKSLEAPNTYDENGFLNVGLHGHQPSLGEVYISKASQYLASFAFLPLGLPVDAPFWSNAASPWSWCRAWSGEDLPADKALYES